MRESLQNNNGPAAFGVRLPIGGPLASGKAIADVAIAAERLGFDDLWVHDFIVWTRRQDRTHISCGSFEALKDGQVPIFHESLTSLAYVAGLTKSIRLGTAVLCLPYRNPIVAARQIANIDSVSDGRLILGVGQGGGKAGHNKDFEVLGIERVDKYARTQDYLRAMIEIWTTARTEYYGPYIAFPRSDYERDGFEFYPKPAQEPHPPIWMGGWSDRGLDLVAEFATGWLPGWITPEEYPRMVEKIHGFMSVKGRDDVDLTVANEIYISIDDSYEKAFANGRATFEVLTEGFQSKPSLGRIMSASLCGGPNDIAQQVRSFIDEGGVSHFELKFIYHDIAHLLAQLEIFAEGVMPEIAS